MTASESLIVLNDVSKVYKLGKSSSVAAVKGANLMVDHGEFVVITGRSGSGKTTLLNLVSGLTQPTSGEVLFEQTEVWRLSDAEQSRMRNQKLGFVFQFPSLMPALTSLENVMLPTIAEPGDSQAVVRERAVDLLKQVGLGDRLEANPRQLSAGEQQRVVIARSLINHPELLLADEPTSNLDEQTEKEIMSLFQRLHQDRAITILLVTHALELAAYGNRSMRMSSGEIV